MRQRKAKDMEARLESCSDFMVKDPSPEEWERCFRGEASADGRGAHRKLYLEIGCGKGQFIIQKAMADPAGDYIAIEGQETVMLRALEKTAAACGREIKNDKISISDEKKAIPNLKFACTFANDMSALFHEGQLAGIYLNFSDPWPKARHAKRRLTYRKRLLEYAWALEDGGFIEIKTDNDGLFEFTLEEIAETPFKTVEMTRDLHSSQYDSRNFVTEYEEKFSSTGKTIHYVKVIIRK